MLAAGDKRDCFVVVDHAGGHHALTKKLTGLTLAQIRQRLGDLDRAKLPGVDQAKIRQRARQVRKAAADPSREFSRAASTATETAPEAVERRKHGQAARCTRTGNTRTHGAADQGAAAVSAVGSIIDPPHPQPVAWSSGSDYA